MAPQEVPIIVPMLVDAYLSYPPPYGYPPDYGNMPPAPNRAFLAPIPQPKYASPKDDNAWIQHDMFDHLPDPPLFRGPADPARVSYERSGIYVSWRIPAHYRTGMTASAEDADFKTKLAKGGYANIDAPGTGASGTRFRQAPNRWVICRTVTPLDGEDGYISIAKDGPDNSSSNPWAQDQRPRKQGLYYGPGEMNSQPIGYGRGMIRSFFVVEGDTVREIESLTESEDIDVTSAPFIDENFPISQQSQSFLGHSVPMEAWDADRGPPKRSTTLTVARSTNPYFADFQPHNSSVFSFFDNLRTTVNSPDWAGGPQSFWIAGALVSYTIVGYHQSLNFDPLAMSLQPGQSPNERLSACRLKLKSHDALSGDILKLLDSQLPSNNPPPPPPVQMRTLCSGVLAGIKYSYDDISRVNPPMVIPGDDIQNAFIKSHPLSVGTNPIDALFGWLRSQPQATGNSPQAALMRLQSFILDNNDDIDSQLQAEDLIATNNFTRDSGGITWRIDPLPGAGGKTPIALPQDILDTVRTLNAAQRHSDALQRERKALQSQLFMCWWKYAADRGKSTRATLDASQSELKNIQTSLDTNNQLLDKFTQIISQSKTALSQFNLTELVEPMFCMQRDPTLLIAGTKNAFQPYSEELNVRIAGQEKPQRQFGDGKPSDGDRELINLLNDKLDTTTSAVVWSLVQETQLSHGPQYPIPSKVSPEYLNAGDTYNDEQGWFPLFIEWQIEYYHIPWQYWEFAPCGPESRWGYRIQDTKLADLKLTDDFRIIKGRSPILPQTSSTLNATLKQVYGKMNPDQLKAALGNMDPNDLLNSTLVMDYLSTAMAGLTDSLTTCVSEAHFVPVTFPGGQMKVASEAMISGNELKLGQSDWTEMSKGMSKTPFASLMDLPANIDNFSPFKPVTHGQFRFTKLNIVDKFGQIVVGIDRVLDNNGQLTHNPLFPCLGETYSLETIGDKANAVMQRSDPWCSFVQIPPCINQPARVNASFVTRYKSDRYSHAWRRIEDWENPVKGWIVINSANVSLQFFTSDGRFIREYSVLDGKVTTHPFAADKTAASDVDPLVAQLMRRFDTSSSFLNSIFQSINTTVQAVQANPSHYAESMLSILGRPLAITTFNCNLELASPPLTDQSTFNTSRKSSPKVSDYEFSLKIGDGDNVFDGLYGLFWENSMGSPSDGYFNVDFYYSYHGVDGNRVRQIRNITTKPLWPLPSLLPNYTEFVDMNSTVFAAIVDPFTPIHIYSALLPIKQLQLPSWSVDRAMARLASFFRKGPTLVAIDVPTFHPNTATETFVVDRDIPLNDPKQPTQTGEIAIPNVSVGDWNWLQPYAQSDGTVKYNELGVINPKSSPQWERAPYVVTEGYLQMKKPFTAPDPVQPPELVFGPGPVIPPSK